MGAGGLQSEGGELKSASRCVLANLLHFSAYLESSQGPGSEQKNLLSNQRRSYKIHRKLDFLGTHYFPRFNLFSSYVEPYTVQLGLKLAM